MTCLPSLGVPPINGNMEGLFFYRPFIALNSHPPPDSGAGVMSEDPTRPIRPGEYGPPGVYGSSRDSGPPGKYADGYGPDGGPGAGQGQGPGHRPGQGGRPGGGNGARIRAGVRAGRRVRPGVQVRRRVRPRVSAAGWLRVTVGHGPDAGRRLPGRGARAGAPWRPQAPGPDHHRDRRRGAAHSPGRGGPRRGGHRRKPGRQPDQVAGISGQAQSDDLRLPLPHSAGRA